MKGFVFSLDAALAVVVVAAFLVAAGGYTIAPGSQWGELSALSTGSDIVHALYQRGVLQTLDKNAIESNLSALLPANLKMSMKLYVYNAEAISATPCPETLADFDFVGCRDYTEGAFVKYPPEGDPRSQHCSNYPDQGGLDFVPGLDSSMVELWCNDIIAGSDCDFDDVVGIFWIEQAAGGVNVFLDRDSRWSAGHTDSIIINGTFGSQVAELQVYNKNGAEYDEEFIACGQSNGETSMELEDVMQINADITDENYAGEWKFIALSGASIGKNVLAEYKVWFK